MAPVYNEIDLTPDHIPHSRPRSGQKDASAWPSAIRWASPRRDCPTWSARNKRTDLAALEQLAREREVGLILMGNPINMRGTEGRQSGWVREFAAALEKRTGLPVKLWDERLTTRGGRPRAALERHQHRKARRRGGPALGRDPAAELSGFAMRVSCAWPADSGFVLTAAGARVSVVPAGAALPGLHRRDTSSICRAARRPARWPTCWRKAGVIRSRWEFLAGPAGRARRAVLQAGEYRFDQAGFAAGGVRPHRARRHLLLRAGGARRQEHVRYRGRGGAAWACFRRTRFWRRRATRR